MLDNDKLAKRASVVGPNALHLFNLRNTISKQTGVIINF